MVDAPVTTVVRLRYSKRGKIRFTSHRDVARVFERALRRADLPIAYTEGFSPRPKMSFGLALSTGHESDGEYVDVHIAVGATLDRDTIAPRLNAVLPEGMVVEALTTIPRSEDSLQQAVTSCTWRIEILDVTPDALSEAVARALASRELPITRTRKGKEVTDDVRPAILALDVAGPTDRGAELIAELATQPRACRPAELLRALDERYAEGRVTRIHQWIEDEAQRCEPLALDAASSGRAQVRVS